MSKNASSARLVYDTSLGQVHNELSWLASFELFFTPIDHREQSLHDFNGPSSRLSAPTLWRCMASHPTAIARPRLPRTLLFSKVTAYFVVGAHAWVSIRCEGTFSMDTACCVWRKVGHWELPFVGRVI